MRSRIPSSLLLCACLLMGLANIASAQQLWHQTYNGSVNANAAALAVAADPTGDVYVVGYVTDASDIQEAAILKYSSLGALLWERNYRSLNGTALADKLITWANGVKNRELVDLNGDGRPDILFTDNVGNLVILYNQGKRRFSTPYTLSVGGLDNLFVGDLNGDKKPDIAVAVTSASTGGSGYVGIYLNNGDGTFTQKTTLSVPGEFCNGVYGADVNGDGKVDLVVGWETDVENDSGVAIYYGDGTGNFTAGPVYSYGTLSQYYPTLVDLNGDGKPDIVVCEYWENDLVVMLNNGDGTFGAPTYYAAGGYCLIVKAVDVNGDGMPDLVVDGGGIVSVFRNLGDGTFDNPVQLTAGGIDSRTIDIADFNKDHKPDIVVQNHGNNTISILLNNFTP